MKLIFIATRNHTHHNSVYDEKIKTEIILSDKDIVDVSPEKAKQLKEDFPLNFFDAKSDGSVMLKPKKKKEAKQDKNKAIDEKKTETKSK